MTGEVEITPSEWIKSFEAGNMPSRQDWPGQSAYDLIIEYLKDKGYAKTKSESSRRISASFRQPGRSEGGLTATWSAATQEVCVKIHGYTVRRRSMMGIWCERNE